MKDDDKKKLCKELIIEFVELVDDKIGGPIMDLPVVDAIERSIIENSVDFLWLIPIKIHDVEDLMPWSA